MENPANPRILHNPNQNKSPRRREPVIWLILGLIILLPVILLIADQRYMNSYDRELGIFYIKNISTVIYYNYYLILISFLTILFPFIFKLIFDSYPLQFIRKPREGSLEASNKYHSKDFLLIYVAESEKIADKIYNRSGVYLLIGCLVAFAGVGIFYSPFLSTSIAEDAVWTDKLLNYLPRFGALFFIEFVAFFFLKQYRIMLEEFRYYEAIKRRRQDNLTLIALIEKYDSNPEQLKLVISNFSTEYQNGHLGQNETTQLIETEKLVNQDLDIFNKVNELVKTIKSK